jgi:peptidoglycan glycosyltransferase
MAGVTVYWARAEARLQWARGELLAGRPESALPVFASLEELPIVGARASAGRELAMRLQPGPAPSPALPLPAGPWRKGLASFPTETLLDLARRTAPLPARRALALLLEQAGERLAALDLAALELDAGQDELARKRVAADPEAFTARALGREVMAVLALRAAGTATTTIVRDRAGRRLGHLDEAGLLTLEDDVEPALVPEAARAVLSAARHSAPATDGPGLPAQGPGLRLSLDLELSRLAQGSLGFNRGSVVLLDAHTGGVLAAVSDAVTRARGGTPAFEDRREPASISKVITAAAGLRAGLDLDDVIRRVDCRGSERFGNGIVWCSYPAGPLQGFDQALAVSCNLAFAHVGAAVGREALLRELRRWGFDRDFALARAGRVVQAEGDLRQLADLSIGLEATNITPLHGALLATVLANEGRMPEPTLLEATEGPMGLAPSFLERLPARDVVAPETVPVLARAMQAVAVYGTAAGVAPPGFPVAMKTGTGAEWRLGYHANYVGVAPWPNPAVAFGIRITHEPTSSRVNRTAREVLRALLEGLHRRMPDRRP